jgi:hypothetical protein
MTLCRPRAPRLSSRFAKFASKRRTRWPMRLNVRSVLVHHCDNEGTAASLVLGLA